MNRPTRITLLSIPLCLVLAGYYSCAKAADREAVHKTAIAARDAYWECLAQDILKVLKTSMPAQDFKLMVEGSCPDQKKEFRIKMSAYLELMHPDISAPNHIAQADYAISAAQADAVSALIKMRSGIK